MTEIISNTFNNPSFLPASAPYNPNSSLLTSLLQFYAVPEHIKQLYLLISSEDKISLRLLEWTVINYAKNESLIINNGITDRFSVHVSYKATLSGYSKDQFDPCCRTERIGIPYLDKILNTTVAQMNFIRWVITNNILTYIRDNYSAIFKDMKHKNKTVKKQKNFKVENCNTTLSFSV